MDYMNAMNIPHLTLLAELKVKQLFPGGRGSLHKLVRKMGFRYRKHENKRFILEQNCTL